MENSIELCVDFDAEKIERFFGDNAKSIRYKVLYFNEDGNMEQTFIEKSGVCVLIEKSFNSPVLVIPAAECLGRSVVFKCWGGLFPIDLKDEEHLSLTPENGFIAEAFYKLKEKGFPVEKINSNRMQEEIFEASGNNPWLLDQDLLIQKILSDSFSVYSIKQKANYFFSIEVDGASFFSENILDQSVSGNENNIYTFNLTQGYHRFYDSEDFREMNIFITDKSWQVFYANSTVYGYW